MQIASLTRLLALCLVPFLASCSSCSKLKPGGGGGGSGPTNFQKAVEQGTKKSLTAFKDKADLERFLTELREAEKRDQSTRRRAAGGMPPPSPAESPAAEPESAAADEKSESADESVTNVQHAGVDEGGIVKLHRGHLIVLRRGRLFTVRIDDASLTPVSQIDAFGPGISPSGAWYDEMLVNDGTVVVIGYSYQRGGTELSIFDMSTEGKLAYRSTYHLRSNDYYSSRNYASRLVGKKLIFYTPLYLKLTDNALEESFPAVRRWRAGAKPADFKRIVEPDHVYRPLLASRQLALHTVTSCDLSTPELDCRATAVMGPPGRVFYVSPSAVYVWMTDWQRNQGKDIARSLVYRLPLNDTPPTALGVLGGPIDQMSFLEGNDQHLNVLVRADATGDSMWRAEVTSGDMALLRVPLSLFGDGQTAAPRERYAPLPKPSGYVAQNRFVGDYVLYGTGSGWRRPTKPNEAGIYAYRFAGGAPAQSLPLPHGVDRIEALGKNAVAVGSDGTDLFFTPVALGASATLRPAYKRTGANQGETRSHGFFYKPSSESEGLLGLPIVSGGRPGFRQLTEGSASILFLKNRDLSFAELGTLASRPGTGMSDNCQASCMDWYGNARPLFFKNRIVALLGYELVEGTLDGEKLFEKARVSFAPQGTTIAR